MAMYLSTYLSNEEVAKARVEMALDEQKEMIKNDFANISLLLVKYKDVCKIAVENPELRREYWLGKGSQTQPERL